MKAYKVQNELKRIRENNKDNPIPTYSINPARGYSFKNIGATDCTLYINNVGFPVAVGDGMLTFGGFDNSFCNDQLYVEFVGGTGDAILVLSRVIEICDFNS